MDLRAFLADADTLLRIRSTADAPGELHRALDFVIGVVGPGFTVERFSSGGKPSALLYTGAERPERFRLILNGHLDVVPAADELFQPRSVDGRLYARGAQDMKITALAQAYAFRELAAGVPYPVALQLVTDEEVGGFNGTLHQLSRGVAADFVIIGEHSRLDIVADSKGIMHASLRATGRAGHGAYPWLGDNALWRLTETLHRIAARYPTPAEAAWRTTVNLARITTANMAVNQIPADGEAWLDIRFPAEDTDLTGRTIEEITEYLQAFCAPGVDVHVASVDPPHHVDHDSADIRRLRDAATGQGYAGDFLYKHGAGDGRHYASHDIDSVVFGIGGDGQHGPDEYAEIGTIAPYHAALCAFLGSLVPGDLTGCSRTVA